MSAMSAMSDSGIHERVSQWLLTLEGHHWLAIAIAAATLIVGVHLLRRGLEGRRARAALDEALRLELATPRLAASGDRSGHLHRQRVVPQRLP